MPSAHRTSTIAPARPPIVARVAVVVVAAVAVVAASCGSEPAPPTAEDYLSSLQAICTETTADLEALPTPPEQISVADFASEASSSLTDEAEQVRRLEPPDELADDHRAFIRNTDEQVAAWRAVAEQPDDLVDATTLIGQLALGRDDLADEMGAPDCRRSAE